MIRDEKDIAAEEEACNNDEKIIQEMRKEADTRLVVAALIITVTFAAGFTIPGGYINNGSDDGMAVLARKAAFKTFVLTDTVALVCATCAAFVYFLKVDFINRHKIIRHYTLAKAFVTISMGAIVIAFIAGLAAVLENSSGLAVSVGIICCSSFIFYYYELRPALRTIRGRPKYLYSEQTKRRGRPTYMIWGTKTPPQKFVSF